MFTFLSRLLLLVLAWGTSSVAWAQVTYSTVPLTAGSFTADVIANGTAANPATSSTTADVDGAGYYLISQDFYTATTAHTSGLPNNGVIPNSIAGYSALTYQLASYSANNSLRIAAAGTGSVTFTTPMAASELYVLAISGSGVTTVNMSVNYSDGTTSAFAGQTYPDWFTVSATQNVYGSSGRASATVPVSAVTAANTAPFLSQVKLTIPANKLNTTITGITFTTATGSGVLNVLAVSAGVAPICSTAPTGLQTVASTTSAGGTALTSACSSTSIYLSVSGLSNLAGYTYQWQSSTTSATTGFTTIAGATSSTYTATGQAVATYYRVLVTCLYAGTGGGTAVASTAVQVMQNAPTSCYCTPTYSNGGINDFVGRVRLGTLDNNTATAGNVSPYYHDYSSQQTGTAATLTVPTLAQGGTATVTLNFGSDGSQYSAVWIDFNQNGSFEATEYFTLGTNAGGGGTAAIPVTVPSTATLGQTKMRIRGGDDNQPTSAQSCGASGSSFGEAEDYLVNIVVASTCTPSTATFSYAASSYCVGSTAAPTVTLATGATAGTFTSTTGLTLNATTGAITLSSSTPGTYTVTNTVAATATACASTATTTIAITAAPTAGFSYATPAAGAACVGGTGTFTPTLASGATAGTFSSTTGLTINATTGVISLAGSTAGTYTVTNTVAATATGCAATSTTTFTVNALPATPTLTTSGTPATGITLTSSASTGNQFYLNGTAIVGATNPTYLINSGNQNGSYTVRVTNAAGCTATSAAVAITVTATTTAQAATSLSIAPNPTPDGLLTLELSGFREAVSLTVLNTLGQRVAESTVASSALGQKQLLNLSALPAGVYVLQARTASGTVEVRRIVRE